MSTATEYAPEVRQFIGRLYNLAGRGTAHLAQLKRNAGNPLSEARDVLSLFYGILPPAVEDDDVETYFLVATLYALNPREEDGSNLGETLAALAGDPGVNRDGVDRRVAVLLDAERDELGYRLRQLVRLIASRRRSVDWARLLHDLLRWDDPGRPVRREWAKSYFGAPE
jgi:CRISPR system Cascade subunit CasB